MLVSSISCFLVISLSINNFHNGLYVKDKSITPLYVVIVSYKYCKRNTFVSITKQIRNSNKNRQGLLPAAVVFIPCKLYPHLQFLSHYYEYYSSSAPKISYRRFKLFSSSVSCNNHANDKTPY